MGWLQWVHSLNNQKGNCCTNYIITFILMKVKLVEIIKRSTFWGILQKDGCVASCCLNFSVKSCTWTHHRDISQRLAGHWHSCMFCSSMRGNPHLYCKEHSRHKQYKLANHFYASVNLIKGYKHIVYRVYSISDEIFCNWKVLAIIIHFRQRKERAEV